MSVNWIVPPNKPGRVRHGNVEAIFENKRNMGYVFFKVDITWRDHSLESLQEFHP